MLRLVIDWGPAQLGLAYKPARLKVDYSVHAMRLKTTPAELDIEIEPPRVELDLDGPMAEIGLKPALETARDWAAKGMQAAYERIGKYARQGDALASFHLGVDVAALAAQEAWPGDGRQINVDVAPKSRVQVTAHGDIHIDYSPADLSMTFPEEPVKIAYRPGAVRSYLAAKAYIDIDVTGDRYSVTG